LCPQFGQNFAIGRTDLPHSPQNLPPPEELEEKRRSQYDPALEQRAKDHIEGVVGKKLEGSFQEGLKNGVALCEMINKHMPGSVAKINKPQSAFVIMENIGNYLDACKKYNMGKPTSGQLVLFQTVDLYEAKNMNAVVQNILSVERVLGKGGSKGSSSTSSNSSGGGKFCGECGKSVLPMAKFCPNCGHKCV